MNKPKYQIGDRVLCEACGDLLDDLSKYGFCLECFNDIQADIFDEDDLEYQDFVPTNAPLSSLTYNQLASE